MLNPKNKACTICGGTSIDAQQSAHYLCVARQNRGAPTPNLGMQCLVCMGQGFNIPDAVWSIITMQIDNFKPLDTAIKKYSCINCAGKGKVN